MDNYLLLKTACSWAANLGLLPYQVFSNGQQHNQMFVCRKESHHSNLQNRNVTMPETLSEMFARILIASALPVHVEIWLENSSATDIVEPIATRFNVNLLARTGEISVEDLWYFLRRISQAIRPIRVFHVNDLLSKRKDDLHSIRKQLDIMLCKYDLLGKLDIKIESLMLTGTQQREFKLPSPPAGNCVFKTLRPIAELHALEAARPGYIENMLSGKLRQYLNDLEITQTKKILTLQLRSVVEKLDSKDGSRSDISTVLNVLKNDLRLDRNIPLFQRQHTNTTCPPPTGWDN